jgi:F-box and WD-40 domain protein CDC4
LSPNRIVSAAADASLRVWDANTYELKHTLSSHAAAITCFQHDETKVVSGSDGTLKLWDIKTGRFICDLITGISSVWQVAFYGNLLVAASNRNGNTVFDVFDFGKKGEIDYSGVDNDKLDLLRRAPWERGNPREPQTYQVEDDGDDDDVFCVGTEDALSPKTHEKWRAMSVRSQRQARRGRSRVPSSGPSVETPGSKRGTRLGVAFGDRMREGDRISAREVSERLDRIARVRSEPGQRTRLQTWTQMFQPAEASGSESGTGSGSGTVSAAGEGEGEGELGLLDVDVKMGEDVE